MRRERAVLLCLVFALAVAGAAQAPAVTHVGLVARPKAYVGPCPAALHFIGTLHVDHHPAVIDYQWERSDGAKGPRQRMTIAGASQKVHDTWTLGARGTNVKVWESLHVLAPAGIESAIVYVHVDCR